MQKDEPIRSSATRILALGLLSLMGAWSTTAAAQGDVAFVKTDQFFGMFGLYQAHAAVEAGLADTIVFESSVNEAYPLVFTQPVELIGNGHTIAQAPWAGGTLFTFDFEGEAVVRDVLLSGACGQEETCWARQQGLFVGEHTSLSLESSRVTGFATTQAGAALACFGWCYVTDCDLDHNVASADPDSEHERGRLRGVGGAISAAGRDPFGAAPTDGPLRELVVLRSRLHHNSAAGGGAVFARDVHTIIEGSTLDHNEARTEFGGAVFHHTATGQFGEPASLRIGNSTLHENSAGLEGGHIYSAAPFVLESSTLTAGRAPRGAAISANWGLEVYLGNSMIEGDANACDFNNAHVASCAILTHPRASCSTRDPLDPSLACPDHQARDFELEPFASFTLATPRTGPVGPLMGRRPTFTSPALNAAAPLTSPWSAYSTDAAGTPRSGWVGSAGEIGALEIEE